MTHRDVTPKTELSTRQCEVLALAASGFRDKEIAQHLKISAQTVKAHMANILQRLEVGNRILAGLMGAEQGYIVRNEWKDSPLIFRARKTIKRAGS